MVVGSSSTRLWTVNGLSALLWPITRLWARSDRQMKLTALALGRFATRIWSSDDHAIVLSLNLVSYPLFLHSRQLLLQLPGQLAVLVPPLFGSYLLWAS